MSSYTMQIVKQILIKMSLIIPNFHCFFEKKNYFIVALVLKLGLNLKNNKPKFITWGV